MTQQTLFKEGYSDIFICLKSIKSKQVTFIHKKAQITFIHKKAQNVKQVTFTHKKSTKRQTSFVLDAFKKVVKR